MARPKVLITQQGRMRKHYRFDEEFARLESFADLWWNPHDDRDATVEELRPHLAEAEVMVVGWGTGPITPEHYAAAPRLKQVALIGGTLKKIAPEAAWERGITITNTARAIAASVCEFTLGVILLWAHRYDRYHAAMVNREPWPDARWAHVQTDVAEMTVGLVGFGGTGRGMASMLRNLGATVLAYDPFVPTDAMAEHGVEPFEDLHDLLSRCDIVSLHAGLTDQTRHMIGAAEFAALRDGTLFVNTARGGIVDQAALLEELRQGRLFAALDVFEDEPIGPDHPMRELDNVFLSPHVAGTYNWSCYRRCARTMVEDVRRFVEGKTPLNVVTPELYSRMT